MRWLPRPALTPSLFGALLFSAVVLVADARAQDMPSPSIELDCAGVDSVDEALRRGAVAFARRAEGARGARARAEPIGTAVACFERAAKLAPSRLDVRVELLRALFYQGEYAAPSDAERKRIFLEARDLFEQAVDDLGAELGVDLRRVDPKRVQERLGARSADAGALFFYGALHWGLWAQSYGKMAALRAGVAKKIRDYGELSLVLAPTVSNAGPHRLVGQLHAEAPRVLFLTMWVDRDRAVAELERAAELAPEDPLNLTYLAEALVEYRRERDRAAQLLAQAVSQGPREHHLVEDRAAIALARAAQRVLGFASGS